MDPTDKPWGDGLYLFVMPRLVRGIHGRDHGRIERARPYFFFPTDSTVGMR
jgi:hypothetical protein